MLDRRLQQHKASGGERWEQEPPPDAASVTTWDTLASSSLLLSKLLFDVGLVADLFRISPLSPTT